MKLKRSSYKIQLKGRLILLIIMFSCLSPTIFSQETFTKKVGPKFLPGHWHIVLTIEKNTAHYQLFNHWYSASYAQYRDLEIPLSEIDKYDSSNDTLSIIIQDNKIKLIDKKYHLKKHIKHQELCASLAEMRKISYAHLIAEKHDDVEHFDLYDQSDLHLPEKEFKTRVDENLKKIVKE
jgi:hypothetical protein